MGSPWLFPVLLPALVLMLMLIGERRVWFRRYGWMAVFAAGAWLQFAMWSHAVPSLANPDSRGFYRLAHGLETDLRSILYRPKLYPLFLKPFWSLSAATGAQCLLKLGMGALLLRLSALLAWRPAVRTWILFLFLFDSLWLFEPLRILDTTLFSFLLLAAIALGMEIQVRFSPGKFLALCLAIGLASLTRQVGDLALLGLLAAAVGMGWLRDRRKVRLAIGGVLLATGVAASGAVWNGWHYGVWRRSVAFGVNAYTHVAYFALAEANSPEWNFVERYLPAARKQTGTWNPAYQHPISWAANALPHDLETALGVRTGPQIRDADQILTRRSLGWVRGHPGLYLRSVSNEAKRLLGKCDEEYPTSLLGTWFVLPPWLQRIERGLIYQPPLVWVVFALAGWLWDRRRRSDSLLPAGAVAAYLFVIPALQLGFTRYALPAFPILLILAGQSAQGLASPAFGFPDSKHRRYDEQRRDQAEPQPRHGADAQ